MLLAIDIGNSNISLGVFKGKRLIKRLNIPTAKYSLTRLRKALAGTRIKGAVIVSVVPKATQAVAKDLKQAYGIKPYIIGKEIRVPMKNLYQNPRQLGQDRLVNAYAALKLYGAPVIVADFGTVVTFDAVSKKKAYLGGLILPGLKISLEALYKNTVLLPKIKLGKPKELISRNTREGMLSGLIYGLAALTDNLVLRLKSGLGKKSLVVGTGGNISLIAPFCREIKFKDINLTLKGLNLLSSEFRSCKNGK